ncbi:hypothetical protein [Pararhodobacter oceanensis]|uniref:Uncharacterized protein n=1 Tax=Pararhodobacter oceanensis TaxID=2172121 RepID=A0A2T8HP39_9RHOB|nr:hypothetical protein [Pararhodobacter oceanensis]PVH27207.1 hypothetical protein DDE20_18855 [Pararhodobacter oceanensis]
MVKVLIDSGLLPPLHDTGAKYGKVSRAVDSNHIDTLFKRLLEVAAPVRVAPTGMYDLAKAAESSRVKLDMILPAVFRGQLDRVCRLEWKKGLEALLVDPVEIREREFEFQPGIPLQMAFEMLGVNDEIGERLISNRTSPPLLPTIQLFGHTEPCVDPSAIQNFLARWATVQMLHAEVGLSANAIQEMLAAAKVKPVYDRNLMGVDIYRRSDARGVFDV